MIIITLKDAPEAAQSWQVGVGEAAEVYSTGRISLNHNATLPIESFPERYHAGQFDWLFIQFYSAGAVVAEKFWRNLSLVNGSVYEYSYQSNAFVIVTKRLEWSLPERVTHRAGSILQVTFRITNLTAAPRSYQIFMALFDPATGSVIAGTTGPISVDGLDTFEVAAEGELTVVAPLKIDYSNVLLQAALYDIQSGEMAVGLQSVLEPPPGAGEQIAPIAGFASGVLVLGMVTGVVADMISNMGR